MGTSPLALESMHYGTKSFDAMVIACTLLASSSDPHPCDGSADGTTTQPAGTRSDQVIRGEDLPRINLRASETYAIGSYSSPFKGLTIHRLGIAQGTLVKLGARAA